MGLFGQRVAGQNQSVTKAAFPVRDTYGYSVPTTHAVLGTPIRGAVPEGMAEIFVGMGCFWGAERLFWQLPGVYTTAVGYAGGSVAYPTYDEVCSKKTDHAEMVRVVYDPKVISLDEVLKTFWEEHDPTQINRQGNDIGTQYRSAIYWSNPADEDAVRDSAARFDAALVKAGRNHIATELKFNDTFYYAEEYHQQYLHKVPYGYCGLQGTGVSCPLPTGVKTDSTPTPVQPD